jgi:TRAP-type C4-dicarboxylate transport system substrate-binding protein
VLSLELGATVEGQPECAARADRTTVIAIEGIRRVGRLRPMRRRVLVVTALAVVLGACTGIEVDKAGSRQPEEPTVLTMVRTDPTLPPPIQEFVEAVERLSEDTIRFEYDDDIWREGDPAQEIRLIEDIQAGNIDIGWVGARAFDSLGVTSFQALLAPFLVDNYELQDRVFGAGIPDRMLDDVDQLGLVGIGVLPGPLRKVMGVTHPFTEPSDFAGVVMGTSGGELADDTFTALGATPTRVPNPATLVGLDGLDYPITAIYGNRYYDTARYVTANVNLWPRPLAIVMGAETSDALTAEQRQILRSAAADSIAPATAIAVAEDTEAKTGLCGTGMTVVEATGADQTALDRVVEPIYTQLEARDQTKAYLAQIRDLKNQVRGPADSFACPTAQPNAASAPTPIDGVYQVTTTFEELADAGDPQPERGNYGTLVLAFDRGRFAISQEDGEICATAHGSYVVDGDRVELSILGASASGQSANRPGEFFVFGWSRYRDTLTLTAVAGETSPIPLLVKPWRRIAETPSASVFAARCPPPPEAFQDAAPTPDTASIDGVYRVTTTAEEERATGDLQPDPGNYGDWVLVFDRGRFAFTQENELACTWAYGTYVVDGERVEWSFLAGGGPSTASVNDPGEFYVFGWSRYRDTLTLTAAPGELSPPPFMIKPWRRTGEAPSVSVFPARCPPPPEALG